MPKSTLNQRQDAIIDAFSIFLDDREAMLHYIIDLGHQLPLINKEDKIDLNLVSGCLSKVWVACNSIDGLLFFRADSNTVITKGLIYLLLDVFSAQLPQDILHANLYFPTKIGMNGLIGFQRSSGLAHMVQTIKCKAAHYA